MHQTSTILIIKKDIYQVIPQRAPMIMIDQLLVCDDDRTVTSLKIREENIFCTEGFFTEPGIVENIAQTAAARVGYICKTSNIPVPIGYIGAVKSLEFYFLPKVDTEIQTEITLAHQVFDVTVVNGKVTVDGKLAAECEMKIFIKKDSQTD